MIITSKIKFEIGKIYTEKDIGGTYGEITGAEYKNYKFQVLREATVEEYFKNIVSEGYNPLDYLVFSYFYQISMD